jgi:subtilisin family serine protease
MRISTQLDTDWRQKTLGDSQSTNFAISDPAIVGIDLLGLGLWFHPSSFVTGSTPSAPALAAASPVGTGADQALHADSARAQANVAGTGIKIGILSDSFNVLGGYGADIADGALPAGVTVLKEGPSAGHDEGRAMAELIHQIAPDAQIYFYTAFDGQTDFANGIAALAAAGCQVIVDDVIYLDEPFFQDGGVVQTAVENVVAQGVSYFTAASNEGANFLQRSFTGISAALPGLSGAFLAENFGSTAKPNPLESLTIARASTATIDLQWDQPFATIGTGNASANSLGMVLYNSTGKIVAYAMYNATGGNPDQILQFTNTTASTSFYLAIVTNGGSVAPGQFKFIVYGQGTTINDRNAGIGSGTIIGHEMVTGANTVGAIAYYNTAEFGGSGTVESFSSVGSGGLLFNAQGQRLTGSSGGASVDFVAPDGSATSVFNPFYGTSAAAPNAAAAAALVLQADPNLTPAEVTAILALTADPVRGAVGSTGAGLINADAAVQLAEATAISGNAASLLTATAQNADTAALAANLLASTNPATLYASLSTTGAASFSATLSDPTGALGLAQVAAESAGSAQSLAMVNGLDPVSVLMSAQNTSWV